LSSADYPKTRIFGLSLNIFQILLGIQGGEPPPGQVVRFEKINILYFNALEIVVKKISPKVCQYRKAQLYLHHDSKFQKK
jgi:hypothetical protein